MNKQWRDHMKNIAPKGGAATKAKLKDDPEYYSWVRSKRKTYKKAKKKPV